jgi:addiction module HigA family antidote
MNLKFLQVTDWSDLKATGIINTASVLISNTEFALNGRKAMPTKSKLQITTNSVTGRRLPRNRPPTHPGEVLFEEFVKPLNMTQAELSRRLGVSYPRLNEIIKGRRSVTPNTALRLSRVLGMSADFWLGLQLDWDLWHAMNSPEAKQINRLKPIPRDQRSFA